MVVSSGREDRDAECAVGGTGSSRSWSAQAVRLTQEIQPVVKRRKEPEIAGVLEFEGLTSDDPTILEWLADHRSQNGGLIRVSQGAKGVRLMFGKEADMASWKKRAEQLGRGKVSA